MTPEQDLTLNTIVIAHRSHSVTKELVEEFTESMPYSVFQQKRSLVASKLKQYIDLEFADANADEITRHVEVILGMLVSNYQYKGISIF